MEIDPKQLIKQFKDITLGFIAKTGGSGAVEIVRSIAGGMEKTLKVLDKYLKDTKDKAKEYYDKSSEKLGGYKSKAVTTAAALSTSVKEKGLWNTAKGMASQVKSKLGEAFSSDREVANGPPEDTNTSPEDAAPEGPLDGVIASIQSLKSSIEALTQSNQETLQVGEEQEVEAEKAQEKQSILDRVKNSFDKQDARASRRNKEINDETNGAKVKEKPGEKKGGPFAGIISAVLGMGGMVKTAITGLASIVPMLLGKGITKAVVGVVPWMVKTVGSGLRGIFLRLIPFLATKIAAVASGGLLSGAAAAASTVAGVAGSAAMSGLAAVGAAIISPIGLAVIATAAAVYGGYKLYKYLNRNSLGSGPSGQLTRLRMMSYGFNETNREHYNKVLDLDMLMKDYVSMKNGKAVYKKADKEFKEKVIKLFGVTREEKDKYKIVNEWYVKRYMPSHAAFMNAYYGAGGTVYLDDLDRLTPTQTFDFVTNYKLPIEVYDHKQIPVFEAPDITVTKEQIDTLLVSITQSAKEKSDKFKGMSPEEVKSEADKKLKANYKAAAPMEQPGKGVDATPADPRATLTKKMASVNLADNKPNTPVGGTEEGEKAPPSGGTASNDKPLQSSIDKVAKASGPMVPGSSSLEGIKSKVPTEKIHNLDPNVLKLFSGMTKEYFDLTGKNILVTEAFRTRADQEALKRSHGAAAAKPGTSLHEFGIAIDINSPDADALDKMGLMRKYGFTRPVTGETWHIEPAGVALDPQGSKSNLEDRTKRILSSPGRGGGGAGAKRGVPKAQMYKRDMTLQNALYNSGDTIEDLVKPQENKDSQILPPLTDVVAKTNEQKSQSGTSPVPKVTNRGNTAGTQEGEKAPPSGGSSTPPVSPVAPKGLDARASETSTAQGNMNPGEFAKLSPQQAIVQASKLVGMNPDTMLAFAQIESSMRPGVKAPTSSATGLFQITDGTWKGLMKKYAGTYNIPADASPTHAYYNSVLGAAYAKENLRSLKGFEGSGLRQDTALYLAHHFGAGGAATIIRAYRNNPNAMMETAVNANSYRANLQELSGKTIAQYIAYLDNKLSKAGATAGAGSVPVPNTPPDAKTASDASRSAPVQKGTVSPTEVRPGAVVPPQASANSGEAVEVRAGVVVPTEVRRGVVVPSQSKPGFMDLSKDALPPVSIAGSISRQRMEQSAQQPQPSASLSLDKTDSILTSMGDTLVQIKTILQSIYDKPGAMGVPGNSPERSNGSPSNSPSYQASQQVPIQAPIDRTPSQTGVSMSRKSVLG